MQEPRGPYSNSSSTPSASASCLQNGQEVATRAQLALSKAGAGTPKRGLKHGWVRGCGHQTWGSARPPHLPPAPSCPQASFPRPQTF